MDKAGTQSGMAEPEGAEGGGGGESMESLLAQQSAVVKKLADKQVTWVKVIQVTPENVLVDIGEKREGVIPASEFLEPAPPQGKKAPAAPAEAAGDKLPTVGQRVPVVLVGPRRDGTTVLSYKRAKGHLGWDAAVKAFGEKARVRGRVLSAIKGGFLVDVSGVSGFLPSSLSDLRPVRNPAKMVGMGVRCYIIELNESKKQVVLSRKAVLEEEVSKRKTQLLDELKVGAVRIGRVVSAGPNGLLVDIGGAEGLVRPADVAWGAPKPGAIERGAKVRVKVLGKPQKEGEPVSLGIKQLTANPADAIRRKYPPKTVVKGKVLEAGAGGVKLELDDKKGAFCPQAECDPDSPVKAGDQVSAIVTGVHPDTFDVVVSLAKFNEIRDRKRVAQYLKAPKPLTLGQLLSPEKGE